MKKLFFTVVLACFVMSSFAQKKVLKAANKAFKKEDYTTAVQLATEASNNPETADNPDVYMLLGKVEMINFAQGGKSDPALAKAAYEQFKIAYEKGDDKLKAQMMEMPIMAQLPGQDAPTQTGGSESIMLLYTDLLNEGNNAFDANDYEKAHAFFGLAADISPNDQLNFFAGYAAESADLTDGMMKYYGLLINSEADSVYENAHFAYNSVISHYVEQEEIDKALGLVRKAKTVFPDKEVYPKWEVEILIAADKLDEAVAELNSVIESGKADAQIYTQLAFLYWKSENTAEAQKYGKSAVELDAENYDANYVLGGAIYDEAAGILREANNERDDTKYQELKDKAVAKFTEAKPYFEKCHEMKPDDTGLYPPLSTIYEQLKMLDKRDEMLAKMEAADQGN